MLAAFMCLFKELSITCCSEEGSTWLPWWAGLYCDSQLDASVQQDATAQVRKPEEELRLEKDMLVPATLLAADAVKVTWRQI